MRVGFTMTNGEATDFTIDGISCSKEDILEIAKQNAEIFHLVIPKELTE